MPDHVWVESYNTLNINNEIIYITLTCFPLNASFIYITFNILINIGYLVSYNKFFCFTALR